MSSLLTRNIETFIRQRPWPKQFFYRIQENSTGLLFVVYQDNINKLTGEDKVLLTTLINSTLGTLSKFGIPIGIERREGFGHE